MTTYASISKTYNNTEYGVFILNKNGKVWNIWWDFYDEYEGLPFECGSLEEAMDDGWYPECDVRDFSDLPNCGDFKTEDDALDYINNKFGIKIKKIIA
jgi:hypothetical protein